MKLFNSLYHSQFLSSLIPTTTSLLQKELNDCYHVLDLGCGPSSPIQYCLNIKSSLGVDNHLPYLKTSKKKRIHNQYYQKDLKDLDFPPNSFDAVIMISVIEHLNKKDALRLLKKAERWAKNKVIITTPNGYWPQDHADDNIYQEHLSEWNINDYKTLNYTYFGLSGLKILWKAGKNNSIEDSLYTLIRFQPKIIWFILIALSQIITYKIPKLALQLFAVKNTSNL